MMRKLAIWLTLLMLLCGAARADVVGRTGDGDFIHRYVADNGQEIFFVSMEEEPYVHMEDVNFDGAADVVVMVALGASNAWYELYLRLGDEYVMAEHDRAEGLANIQLLPEMGLVYTGAANGYAGALHERALYRWNGTRMECIRRAVSREYEEATFTEGCYTQAVYSDLLHLTVTAYDPDTRESVLLWEAVTDLEMAEALDVFGAEDAYFWQGLR